MAADNLIPKISRLTLPFGILSSRAKCYHRVIAVYRSSERSLSIPIRMATQKYPQILTIAVRIHRQFFSQNRIDGPSLKTAQSR